MENHRQIAFLVARCRRNKKNKGSSMNIVSFYSDINLMEEDMNIISIHSHRGGLEKPQ